jgi:hypothetical protein
MDLSPVIAAVLSAAVIAALVSAFVTLVHQRRQFDDATRNRFLELRRERYAELSAAILTWTTDLNQQRVVARDVGLGGTGPIPDVGPTTRIVELAEEIGLLGPPSVTRPTGEVAAAVLALGPFAYDAKAGRPLQQKDRSQHAYWEAAEKVNEARMAFAKAAKADLGTDVDPKRRAHWWERLF